MRYWLLLLGSLWGLTGTAQAELPAVSFYLNTAYLCGGIGSDQSAAFKAARTEFPLSLLFGQQLGERTAYIADVQVVIRDEHDQTLVNINSDGPYCLFDIDPGHYTIHSTYEGHTLSHQVQVQGLGNQASFIWPETLNPKD